MIRDPGEREIVSREVRSEPCCVDELAKVFVGGMERFLELGMVE